MVTLARSRLGSTRPSGLQAFAVRTRQLSTGVRGVVAVLVDKCLNACYTVKSALCLTCVIFSASVQCTS